MDPASHSSPNWNKKLQDQQHISEDYYIEQNSSWNAFNQDRKKFNHFAAAHGSGLFPWMTRLACVYLAGLAFARTQSIPGYLYFRNRQFNWIGSLKFVAAGYLFGEVLSIFAFGNPYLVEDEIRRKLRACTQATYFEAGITR